MANPIKAVKGIKKATKLPGGKKGRAIESKVRKEFGMPKGITAGKLKVIRKVEKLDTIADARTYGNIGYIYKKGKLIEKDNNHSPVKVKPRALTKVTNRALKSDKNLTKTINKIAKSQGQAIKPNAVIFSRVPKVPVKRRGK